MVYENKKHIKAGNKYLRLEDIIEFNNSSDEQSNYKILKLLTAYIAALSVSIAILFYNPLWILPAYPTFGVFLLIVLSRHLRWWKMTNNLSTIFRTKMRFVLRWLFAMPRLLFILFWVKMV